MVKEVMRCFTAKECPTGDHGSAKRGGNHKKRLPYGKEKGKAKESPE
jgi:hypothetical protein